MRPRAPFALLVHVFLAMMWIMLSATAAAHEGAHPTTVPVASSESPTVERHPDPATNAPITARTTRAVAQDYVGPAPWCPGGAGGACCCGVVAGAIPAQARITSSQSAVLTLPCAASQRPLACLPARPLAMALLVAATHGSRAPPVLS